MPPEVSPLTAKTTETKTVETQAPDKTATDAAALAAAAQQEKPSRPEGFGDALAPYWDDAKGADYARLTNDVTALQAFKAERDSLAAQVPENLDDYEVALPADFQIPEGMTFETIKDHPILADARAFAKENGLTKDQFKGLVALQAKSQLAEHNQLVEASKKEWEKLGTKAAQRRDAYAAFFPAILGTELGNKFISQTFAAWQIEAGEKIMAAIKSGGPKLTAVRESGAPEGMTQEQWDALSPSDRLAKGRELDRAKAKTA